MYAHVIGFASPNALHFVPHGIIIWTLAAPATQESLGLGCSFPDWSVKRGLSYAAAQA